MDPTYAGHFGKTPKKQTARQFSAAILIAVVPLSFEHGG
jgi:hypothetical protein